MMQLEFTDPTPAGPDPDKALVASVKRWGVLNPVLVYPPEHGRFRVAAGVRRVKAARLAGLAAVPARILPDWSWAAWATVGLMENAQRSANPVQELVAIEELLRQGADETTIARITGMKVQTIRKRLKLQHLNDILRQGVENGAVSVGVAEAAAKLPPLAQQRLAAKVRNHAKLTGEDVAAERRQQTTDALAALPVELFAPDPEVERDAVRQGLATLATQARRLDWKLDEFMREATRAYAAIQHDLPREVA